jgi:hypothetical protein
MAPEATTAIPDERMTMAVAEVTEAAAVLQVGPSSSRLAAHPEDGATTGVCWSFSDSGNPLFAGVI